MIRSVGLLVILLVGSSVFAMEPPVPWAPDLDLDIDLTEPVFAQQPSYDPEPQMDLEIDLNAIPVYEVPSSPPRSNRQILPIPVVEEKPIISDGMPVVSKHKISIKKEKTDPLQKESKKRSHDDDLSLISPKKIKLEKFRKPQFIEPNVQEELNEKFREISDLIDAPAFFNGERPNNLVGVSDELKDKFKTLIKAGYAAKDMKQKTSSFKEALELATNINNHWLMAQAAFGHGGNYAANKKYDDAIKWYSLVIDWLSPNLIKREHIRHLKIKAHYCIAEIYQSKGQVVEALDHYEKALKLNNSQFLVEAGRTYVGLGKIYTESNPERAIVFFKYTLKIVDENETEPVYQAKRTRFDSMRKKAKDGLLPLLIERGEHHYERKRVDDACSDVDEAIKLLKDSDDSALKARAFLLKGDLLGNDDRFQEALQWYKKVEAVEPGMRIESRKDKCNWKLSRAPYRQPVGPSR